MPGVTFNIPMKSDTPIIGFHSKSYFKIADKVVAIFLIFENISKIIHLGLELAIPLYIFSIKKKYFKFTIE